MVSRWVMGCSTVTATPSADHDSVAAPPLTKGVRYHGLRSQG